MQRIALGLALLSLTATAVASERTAVYEVAITNMTKGQTFTPQLVVTHTTAVSLFALGEPASEALSVLAEDGSPAPLIADLQGAGTAVRDIETFGELLAPGATSTVRVEGRPGHDVFSVAAMLIPTNDTFFAINGQRLPLVGSATYLAPAYDAGTEANDQNCLNIPGPRCRGVGSSPGTNAGDEGFVHIGNGFHELAADDSGGEVLRPFQYDWRNPVAAVRVRRVR